MKSIMLALIAAGAAPFAMAADWDFRGEPNSWGQTRMEHQGNGIHVIRQFFAAGQDEFKVARSDGWVVSFPANGNMVVPSDDTTFDIVFNEGTSEITVTEVGAETDWCFRGTANSWEEDAMFSNGDGTFEITMAFANGDAGGGPRFKISECGSNWAVAFPTQDFTVAPNTEFDITFNEVTQQITATPIVVPPTEWCLSVNGTESQLADQGSGLFFIESAMSAGDNFFVTECNTGAAEVIPVGGLTASDSGTFDITFDENAESVTAELQVEVSPWCFRGTANDWNETRMELLGDNASILEVTFGQGDANGGPRFKISECGSDWAVAFPAEDVTVDPDTTVEITFDHITNAIDVTPVGGPVEIWNFRGTPSTWNRVEMTSLGNNIFATCQDFANGDATGGPRFKVENGLLNDWDESFPVTDVVVAANTSFDITFNSVTKEITTTPKAGNCNGDINPVPIVVERSLLINDQATLGDKNGPFSLRRTLDQIASKDASLNSTDFFIELWNTQNPIANGGTCETSVDGMPHFCRPAPSDGVLAIGANGFTPDDYIANYRPIALINRFDLQSADLSDCGEHRIIYGLHSSAVSLSGRNFIIFEPKIPNPTPGNAEGCRDLIMHWDLLSAEDDAAVRQQQLEQLYYNGLPGFRPAIHFDHFSNQGVPASSAKGGQIRSNQFLSGSWVLKEFKTDQVLLNVDQTTVKENPFGPLFNDQQTVVEASRGEAFRADFLANLPSLLVDNVADIKIVVSNDEHLNIQSHASGGIFENNFQPQVDLGSGAFRGQIQDRLTELGSSLTVDQVLRRASTQTCGGCHQPSTFNLTGTNALGGGLSFPSSSGFVHVNENPTFNGTFNLSPALRNVFLPARQSNMEAFLGL
ncbi:MAG: hypothetical protein CMF25_04515 [Kangiellaceae bacterium]|nr:hypothetical protein [Kangiellaceae bacterium]|tara:strand:- start:470 stop:3082 length:2613 start_codon:yes stop_codon:yes gene_type:complete